MQLAAETCPLRKPYATGYIQVADDAHDDFLHCVGLSAGLEAIVHFPEDETATPSNFPASFNCISMRST